MSKVDFELLAVPRLAPSAMRIIVTFDEQRGNYSINVTFPRSQKGAPDAELTQRFIDVLGAVVDDQVTTLKMKPPRHLCIVRDERDE
jgi:hypothetical protein